MPTHQDLKLFINLLLLLLLLLLAVASFITTICFFLVLHFLFFFGLGSLSIERGSQERTIRVFAAGWLQRLTHVVRALTTSCLISSMDSITYLLLVCSLNMHPIFIYFYLDLMTIKLCFISLHSLGNVVKQKSKMSSYSYLSKNEMREQENRN